MTDYVFRILSQELLVLVFHEETNIENVFWQLGKLLERFDEIFMV